MFPFFVGGGGGGGSEKLGYEDFCGYFWCHFMHSMGYFSEINYWALCFVMKCTLKHINDTKTDGQYPLIRNFNFGMLRLQVFYWLCLKYLIILGG